jgi:curved DNA-binding protein CbpA
MGNSSSRQYSYHQYYNVVKKDKSFDFSKINYETLDPYEVLQVPKNFTWNELKDAYKHTAYITHPDKEGGNEIVFKFVAECFKKLAYEYKARTEGKNHLELKKEANEFYSGEERIIKPPPINENFHEKFNKTFNMCKLENEEQDFGYGDLMEKSTKDREDFEQENLFKSQKFNNQSFNSIFTKHVPPPSKEIIKYIEPEPMILAKKMSYTEIGGKRPDDYSSSVEKDGRNSLTYTDYKKAYNNVRLVDEALIKKHRDFNSVDEFQAYRDNKTKKSLTDKEKKLIEQKKLREEREEQERLERIKEENIKIRLNNEKASRLFIK